MAHSLTHFSTKQKTKLIWKSWNKTVISEIEFILTRGRECAVSMLYILDMNTRIKFIEQTSLHYFWLVYNVFASSRGQYTWIILSSIMNYIIVCDIFLYLYLCKVYSLISTNVELICKINVCGDSHLVSCAFLIGHMLVYFL